MVDLTKDCGMKWFKPSEFRKACPSCDWTDMEQSFLAKLDAAREKAGIPFVINSAFRSKEYELQKGRTGSSSHCKGVAVDLRCSCSSCRFAIVSAAIATNIHRIGIGKNFIHLDDDDSKPSGIWLYAD